VAKQRKIRQVYVTPDESLTSENNHTKSRWENVRFKQTKKS